MGGGSGVAVGIGVGNAVGMYVGVGGTGIKGVGVALASGAMVASEVALPWGVVCASPRAPTPIKPVEQPTYSSAKIRIRRKCFK